MRRLNSYAVLSRRCLSRRTEFSAKDAPYPSTSRMWLLSAACALSSQISRSAVLDGHLSSERKHDRASRREEWRVGRDTHA